MTPDNTDVGLLYEPESPFYYLTVERRRHWEEDVFGYSVASREPKGIVVIGLPELKKADPDETVAVQQGVTK